MTKKKKERKKIRQRRYAYIRTYPSIVSSNETRAWKKYDWTSIEWKIKSMEKRNGIKFSKLTKMSNDAIVRRTDACVYVYKL